MPMAHNAGNAGRGPGTGPGAGRGGRGPNVAKRPPWNNEFAAGDIPRGQAENIANLAPPQRAPAGVPAGGAGRPGAGRPLPAPVSRTPLGAPGGGGVAPVPAAAGRQFVSEALNKTLPRCQQHIYVGDRVRDRHSGRLGVAMYVGPAEFARGNTVVGLRLDNARTTTDCDGKFKGERYFRCTPGHGLYIPFEDAEVLQGEDAGAAGAFEGKAVPLGAPPAAGGGAAPGARGAGAGNGGGAGNQNANPNQKGGGGPDLPPEENIADLEREVEQLVGLADVKSMLQSLRNSVEVQRRRAHLGVKEERVLNMLFLGNPGTGKTKVAKLVARMMRSLGVLQTGQLVEVTRKDLIGPHHGETAQLTCDAVKRALGGVLFIDEAYALKHEGSSDSGGQEAINTLVKEIEDHQGELVVILAGYQREMTAFLSSNSGLSSRFPHTFNFADYTTDEMAQIVRVMVAERGFTLDEPLRKEAKLAALVQQLVKGTEAAKGNGRLVRNLVEQAIKRQTDRVFAMGTVSRERLVTLTEPDFFDDSASEQSMGDVLARLDDVIGLADAKSFMRSLAAQLQVNRERKEAGLPSGGEQSLHMLFVGNPGTGKTTMARMVASLLKSLRMLRLGHVVEADRGSFVAGYAGQTAIKTRAVVESALGGVLIIDEAYALVEDAKDSFGREALDTIVKMLEDNRDDVVAILAGYPNEMKQLMSVNPGLASRFPTTVHFRDYSSAELMAIADKMLVEEHLQLHEHARAQLLTQLEVVSNSHSKASGNARAVRNMLEQAKRRQALRLVNIPGKKTPEELVLLTTDDVRLDGSVGDGNGGSGAR
mmetsp:Transcript_9630/g.24926  ORF Transcript_9630/g.24926 Transcript_9630/m.24926 type:complete len:819 (-) Transcript_9630:139-2595(-)